MLTAENPQWSRFLFTLICTDQPTNLYSQQSGIIKMKF